MLMFDCLFDASLIRFRTKLKKNIYGLNRLYLCVEYVQKNTPRLAKVSLKIVTVFQEETWRREENKNTEKDR